MVIRGLFVALLVFCITTAGEAREVWMESQQNHGEERDKIAVMDTTTVHESQPIVRVGLLEGYDRLDFRVRGTFSITDLEGKEIFPAIETNRRWRCKVDKSIPAKFIYSILVGTFNSEANAGGLAARLKSEGYQTRVIPYGRKMIIGKREVHNGLRWRVIVGAYDRESDARPVCDRLAAEDIPKPRILRHRIKEPSGTIELYDSEYDRNAMVENGFRIIPSTAATEITLYDIRVGVGYHWEHLEDRIYRGMIEVRLDSLGELTAINRLLLDDYLKGVVPSEMHPTYPLEALKAQAVAARSYTVARLADNPSTDAADFTATVAFQVYSGITREDPLTTKAVMETAGEVLRIGGKVCEAYFSSNSGGHTESKEYWSPPGESYLVGVPVMPEEEAKEFKLDLTREADVEKWVRSHPDNFSNPRGTEIELLNRNARYFRWEVTYTRRELEKIIRRKLGFDIGTLIDLQPLRRGTSGRIFELEILGSHRNYRVVGELNIRRVLSETTLNSSCFIVEPVMGDMGSPVEITLIGAGFGHGVGMDQTAAGVMATKGYKYRKILAMFYRGAKVQRIW